MSQPQEKKKNLAKGCLVILLLGAGLGAAALFLLPWQGLLESRLKVMAEARGLKDVQLHVAGISPTRLQLKDVVVGGATPLQLKNLALEFTPEEALHGRLQRLVISGLAYTLGEEEKAGSEKSAPPPLPLRKDDMIRIPLQEIRVEESRLDIAQKNLVLGLPFTATLLRDAGTLELKTPGFSVKAGGAAAETGEATLALKLEEDGNRWKGPWKIKNIVTQGFDPPLPSFEGAGQAQLADTMVKADGSIKSRDGAMRVQFRVDAPLDAPEKATLQITEASMPWQEGKISAQNVMVALGAKKDIRLNLKVEKISLDALMQLLTGKRATATGLVSGMVPVTIKPDGSLVVHEGRLQAESPGTISLQEDAIPGDNEQLALVRQILKKLNYSVLSVGLENDKDGKLALRMALEGLNPDFQEGHPVKLNVQLGGDVLGFLQQNVMLLFDPKKLLHGDGIK